MIGLVFRSQLAGKLLDQGDKAEREGTARHGVHLFTIRHDGWCALLARRGACDCEPDISFGEVTS